MRRALFVSLVASLALIERVAAASIDCSQCEVWNQDQAPFQIFGNTYYVGTRGLSSVLITSAAGHVLIDGALPQSAPLIARHVQQLGFKMSDVKLILNSHAHFDHAGGIAELQRISGARVIASDRGVSVLRSGKVERSDPQFEELAPFPFPGSSEVEALGRRLAIELGDLRLSVIHTPGHTPGGTSWRWQSCEAARCLNVVYADSLSAISDDSFEYGGDERYPAASKDMFASIAAVAAAPCDILMTAHPERTGMWSIIDPQGRGNRTQLVDQAACQRYAATARQAFERRLRDERK